MVEIQSWSSFPMCVRRQMSCSVLWCIAHSLFVTKLDMLRPQGSLTIVRMIFGIVAFPKYHMPVEFHMRLFYMF